MSTRIGSLGALAVALVLSLAPARAQDLPARPPGGIADGASLLTSSELSALEGRLAALEKAAGSRLVVLTVADTKGVAPKTIAVNALNSWQVGQRSVLLLICMKPHELYIQPGTELNVSFDAATASSICAETIAPKMRAGDKAGAITAGLDAIARHLGADVAAATGSPPSDASSAPSTVDGIIGLVFLLFLLGGGAVGVGVVVILLVAMWRFLRHVFGRKCPKCGLILSGRSRTIENATYVSTGRGETTYTCVSACGFNDVVAYTISMLDNSSSSSYDSSSSSSSSGPSSDGSGGGGSSW